MVVFAVGQRSQNGPAIGMVGQFWQVFAKLDAGKLGTDRSELATDFRRCVRFRIDRIQLAWTTAEHDQQDRFRFAAAR